jgi:hypothetical protein
LSISGVIIFGTVPSILDRVLNEPGGQDEAGTAAAGVHDEPTSR